MDTKPTLISIDWDFFMYNGKHAGDWVLYDWGTSHDLPPSIQEVIWVTRAHSFIAQGLSFESEVAIDPTRGCTSIADFAKKMHKTYDTQGGISRYLNSHGDFFRHIEDLSGIIEQPMRIINFDAHADLGYNDDDELDCGSWALIALELGYIDEYIQVYPDWLGLAELEGAKLKKRIRLRPHLSKIKFTTWSEWTKEETCLTRTPMTYIAHSTPWTPPHLDPELAELIRLLNFEHKEEILIRNWDKEQIEKIGRDQKELMEKAHVTNR